MRCSILFKTLRGVVVPVCELARGATVPGGVASAAHKLSRVLALGACPRREVPKRHHSVIVIVIVIVVHIGE